MDDEEVWIDLFNITALSVEQEELENFVVAVTLVNATEYVSAPYADMISALRMYCLLYTSRGFRIATSTGGTVTGEGGNFLIVDDPLSALQARSTAERDNANIWFDQSFSTRLNDKEKGVILSLIHI